MMSDVSISSTSRDSAGQGGEDGAAIGGAQPVQRGRETGLVGPLPVAPDLQAAGGAV